MQKTAVILLVSFFHEWDNLPYVSLKPFPGPQKMFLPSIATFPVHPRGEPRPEPPPPPPDPGAGAAGGREGRAANGATRAQRGSQVSQ